MLKFFKIADLYINYLRKIDSRVMDKNNHRINLGVVLTINNIKYYVPLSDIKGKDKYFIEGTDSIRDAFSWDKRIMVITNKKNEKIALLRFDYMLPVPDDQITVINRTNLTGDYKTKVSNEYKFCNSNKDKIKKIALEIYKVRVSFATNNTDLSNIMDEIQWNDGRRKDFKKYKKNLEHTRSGTCDFKALENGLSQWNKLLQT